MATPRVVVAHRASEYEELIARHGTRGQVGFVLGTRGRDLAEVDAGHEALHAALATVAAAIPADWRRARVERADLARFVMEPGDIVVAVGPDGLVANLAKYLDGQPVIGVDPRVGVNAGVLVTHRASDVAGLLTAVARGAARTLDRTMVEAVADDDASGCWRSTRSSSGRPVTSRRATPSRSVAGASGSRPRASSWAPGPARRVGAPRCSGSRRRGWTCRRRRRRG
ncbi:hypothetical protein ACQBJO_15545 [Janibacter sp. G349]|uniref:hypothetical protein n=1 Tax=Janibacter sp. G349 TaxID=3405424 RepID=UPI003D2D9C40